LKFVHRFFKRAFAQFHAPEHPSTGVVLPGRREEQGKNAEGGESGYNYIARSWKLLVLFQLFSDFPQQQRYHETHK